MYPICTHLHAHFYSFIAAPVLVLRLSYVLHSILLRICLLCKCEIKFS